MLGSQVKARVIGSLAGLRLYAGDGPFAGDGPCAVMGRSRVKERNAGGLAYAVWAAGTVKIWTDISELDLVRVAGSGPRVGLRPLRPTACTFFWRLSLSSITSSQHPFSLFFSPFLSLFFTLTPFLVQISFVRASHSRIWRSSKVRCSVFLADSVQRKGFV